MPGKQATASAGSLDPTFGKGGVVILPQAVETLPLPEGKLLVVTYPLTEEDSIKVVRLKLDGSFDPDFGDKGVVSVPVYGYQIDWTLPRLTAMPDGGWLIVVPRRNGRILVRQRQDGALEESFGNKGILFFPPTSRQTGNYHVESDFRGADSAGLVAADVVNDKIVFGFAQRDVWRLLADGSLDTTFNGTGSILVEPPGIEYVHCYIDKVVVQKDGRVVIAGSYSTNHIDPSWHLFVTRINEDGSVDTSFNEGRAVTLLAPADSPRFTDMTIRASDGRIVLAGRALSYVRGAEGLIVVLNASGSYNQVFNNGQPLFVNKLVPDGLMWRCCAEQDNGSIILSGAGGSAVEQVRRRVLVARYLADGSLDPSFNGKGWTIYKAPDNQENYDSGRMVITLDGRHIVICGGSDSESGWVVRFQA